MGTGASFNLPNDMESRLPVVDMIDKFHSASTIIDRKQAADFKGTRQMSLPIIPAKSGEVPRIRRPLRTQQSIKAMSLRNRSRRENSYRIQKELAISLVNLHKQNFSGDKLGPTAKGTHERIDSILNSLDMVNTHYYSNREILKEVDECPLSTEAILIVQAQRAESIPVITVSPQKKTTFGLHSKRPPALKLSIQDDSDWIQVDDDGDFGLSPRRMHPVPLAGKNENEQSYMFTQSGTIFVDGFLEGIGKEGIVGTGR